MLKIGKVRKVLGGFSILASLFLLNACGANDKNNSKDANTLTFYSWDNQTTFSPVLKAFEDKYPDVKVEFSHKPPVDEYIQGLQTKLLSNTAADVFVMGAENKSNLINNHNVKDLSKFNFVNNLNTTNRETYGKDGKVYAASISSWGGGIAYNKELLSSAGYNTVPNTWTEFIDMCLKLKKQGITPYYEGTQSGGFMSLFALIGSQYEVNGGNRDNDIFAGKSSFSKEYKKPLEMWNTLVEQEILTTDTLGLTDDQIMNEFANESVAMVAMGPWNVASTRSSSPNLDFGIAPFPGEKAGEEYCPGAPSPGLSININAKNPELSEKFLEFMTTYEAAEIYNGDGSSNNMYTTKGTEQINEKIDPALKNINELVQAGKIYLPVTSWESHQDQLATTLRSSMQELLQKKKTTTQVLKDLDDKLAEVQK